MANELLTELNAFRAAEGKAPFADWRKARHMPLLEEYRAAAAAKAAAEPAFEEAPAEELAEQVGRTSADIARDEALVVSMQVKGAKDLEPGVHTVQVEKVRKVRGKNIMRVTAKVVDDKPATKDKTPSYKQLPRLAKSAVEKPLVLIHSYLDEHPELTRKQAVAALVALGINFYTARTQYQKWYTKRKEAK